MFQPAVSAPISVQNEISSLQEEEKGLRQVKDFLDEISYLVQNEFFQESDPILAQVRLRDAF